MKSTESAGDEWQRLLKGGFAFETAPFAAHPLDARRAQRMVLVARRAGATDVDILLAAENYLRSRGLNEPSVDEQLERVVQFVGSYQMKQTFKRLWLMFWNSTGNPVNDTTDQIVRAFDPRISDSKIVEFMEGFYLASTYSIAEKMHYATRKKLNPYPATANLSPDHRLLAYTCGHNPWLEVRFCYDVRIWSTDDGYAVNWSSDSCSRNQIAETVNPTPLADPPATS